MDITHQQDYLKSLYNQQKPKTYAQVSALFEENYHRLLKLIPALKQTSHNSVIKQQNENNLYLLVEEITTYTATFTLTHQLDIGTKIINKPDIKFKAYFDAQLIQVISVCNHTTLNHNHPYLAQCSDINIQWELNMFLERWLDYCLDKYQGKLWQIA